MPAQKATAQKKFFGGVAVLMPATLFTKLIGLFYKIPLLTIVGVEGMAYFLSAYHIYSLLFVLSAAGLPTALSLLVSRAVSRGALRESRVIFRTVLLPFLLLGLLGSGLLMVFCYEIAGALSMPEAAPALVAIAPCIFLSVFAGAARGWFQGHHDMWPTALSEVIEAGGKLFFGLAFARRAVAEGCILPDVAAAAIFGITAGVFLSALFLLVLLCARRYGTVGEAVPKGHPKIWREVCRVALPVTVSASVMSLVSLLDTVLISGRLQKAGFAPGVANAMYSSYGNLAVPFYNLIPALLSPVTVAMVPNLTAAVTAGREGETARICRSALRLSALFAMPAAMGMAAFAKPILSMLYEDKGAVSTAAPLLVLLAGAVLPGALITLCGAALQAAGHPGLPVVAMLMGSVVKLAVEIPLLAMPAVGIMAAPISTLCCNAAVLIVESIMLYRLLPAALPLPGDLFRPFLAGALAVGSGVAVFGALTRFLGEGKLTTLVTVATTGVFYLPAVLLCGAIRAEDLKGFPVLEKFGRIPFVKRGIDHDKRREISENFEKEHI